MPPIVEFGSPVQRAKTRGQSFWHVPIKIYPRVFKRVGPATLSHCRVYLDLYRGDDIANKIRLGFGDMYTDQPKKEETLQAGRPLLIPVVSRSEDSNDGRATIADLAFHNSEGTPNLVENDRKKNKFRLRVKSGKDEWVSPHFYIIRVPIEPSNGQFSVEIEFEGEGTQGL